MGPHGAGVLGGRGLDGSPKSHHTAGSRSLKSSRMTALLNQNDDEELPDPFVDRARYFKKLGEAAARARQRREQDDKDEEVRGD